ncbi:hypothetical protein P6F26_04655 [Roseibacterium sp. SDUM158017]|uniref:hypothetical protein n=1 Tax=Roseicyclus salinarum TaxID=3036773 RepID=UPI002415808A|nr:hypothetical protein [Roseibacterium sp. SDUM158017]MDG4647723.1 hypothetical protein [Roseibacterium sp. SDUM158017]
MASQTKIATCSYCGRRQTLQLTARQGHELACGSCGAPLHEMKWLKAGRDDETVKRSPRRPAPHGGPLPPTGPGGRQRDDARHDPRKTKRRNKRKGLLREVFEEAFDILEDIFD